jgi:glycosyltransferase involved in cell wall biosynthesis
MQAWADQHVWCVIPVYNNGGTVKAVAQACRAQLRHVVVVDDGCTDVDVTELLSDLDVTVLVHAENRGKGQALLTALDFIHEQGGEWMLCVDADGQHHAEDIPRFFAPMQENPTAIVVGARDFSVPNVPGGSKFGRKFSNFWVKLECGAMVSDSQSGFRAYPVELLRQMRFRGARYDFEVEVLTKAVWYGLSIVDVPIQVTYLPKEERISHFDQWRDNLRLTHRHGMLVSRRLNPWPHRKLVKGQWIDFGQLIRHPRRFLSMLLNESATPVELGISAFVGIVLATLPLIACHTVTILYATTKLSLNRLLAVTIQNLCNPPLVPVACIMLGHWMRSGRWNPLPEDFSDIMAELPLYFVDWLLGSLVLAPLLGLGIGLVVYGIAQGLQRRGNGRLLAD